jgi:hypothetical protein
MAGRRAWWLATASLSPVGLAPGEHAQGRRGCPEGSRARAAEGDDAMVNKVVPIGNLGRDPELFHAQSGQSVARLSVATNEVWMKDGERQRRTE